MTVPDIARWRLASQQITRTSFTSPKEIVSWMGVMQAQDPVMAKWAIGIRLPGSTQQTIESAIDKGQIIRTHLLRPTWHFVSPDDIYWMLQLSASRIKGSLKTRQRFLELTPSILRKSNAVIEKTLATTKHATREELITALRKANIAVNSNRASHLFLWAELEGLICSGASQQKKSTYTLLNEWVPQIKAVSKDQALAMLAQKYFNSHCPATLADFTWWSGLTVTEARHAVELLEGKIISESIGGKMYRIPASFSEQKNNNTSAFLLPAFDEYLISYKDRSAVIDAEVQEKTISFNGIFRPVIVINGKVTGIWQRTIKKEHLSVLLNYFKPPPATSKKLISSAVKEYARFLGKKIS